MTRMTRKEEPLSLPSPRRAGRGVIMFQGTLPRAALALALGYCRVAPTELGSPLVGGLVRLRRRLPGLKLPAF